MEQELKVSLKRLREQLKLTPYEASEQWKIPLATLKAWEEGTVVPSTFSLPTIHALLAERQTTPGLLEKILGGGSGEQTPLK